MHCRIEEMRNKDVVCIKDGVRLGYVCDVEVDTCTAQLVSFVVCGRNKCWGVWGREDDMIINWCDIEVIGEDTILVNCNCDRFIHRHQSKLGLLGKVENLFQ